MTKCDFCTESDSEGKCFLVSRAKRKDYCEEAIRQMVKALGNNRNDTKRGKPFR